MVMQYFTAQIALTAVAAPIKVWNLKGTTQGPNDKLLYAVIKITD